MEAALIAYLLADTAIAGIVSTRLHWSTLPQGVVMPALLLTRVSGRRDNHMLGASGLVESRVQFDAYADTYTEMVALSKAVRDALSGAAFTQGSIKFQGCFLESERHSFEKPPNSSTEQHRGLMDFTLWHADPVA